MKIIVPMAGVGQRFVDAGYLFPKPLISVSGKLMLQRVIDMFGPSDEFVFICNEDHKIRSIISGMRPNSKIIEMPAHKNGPVWTVSSAFGAIKDDEPIIVAYCDGAVSWDREKFEHHILSNQLEGCLFTHTGFHPHTLSSTKMAFIKQVEGRVMEVKEKASYTNNPMQEFASSGVYYFRRGLLVKKYFDSLWKQKINHGGEYYITLVYNLMIQDGLSVGFFNTDYVEILGTPQEVENFEAWGTILKGHQVRCEEDLIRCYHYWKRAK